jgi:prophage DNA circulation protein
MSATTIASLTGLFPASFNGAPFYVREDGAETGRRLHIAEFPGAETPFIEDLGQKANCFNVTGYVVGDDAVIAMATIEAACDIPGPGVLVMPAQGLIAALCKIVKRRRELDRAGLFAFTAEFVRSGLASPLAPAAVVAQAAFTAVTAYASAASGWLNGGVSL